MRGVRPRIGSRLAEAGRGTAATRGRLFLPPPAAVVPESGGGPSSSSAPRRAIPPGELQRIERLLGDLDIAYLDAEDLLKLRGVLEALHAPLGGREATLDRIMAVEMRILADLTRREAGEA